MGVHAPSSPKSGRPARAPIVHSQGRPSSSLDSSTHVLCRLCQRPFRAITYTHLRYQHGILDPEVYKKKFSLSLISAVDVCQRISRRKLVVGPLDLQYIRKNWGKRPLKQMVFDLGISATTLRAHARRLGLKLLVEKWNRDKILTSLRKARRRGLALHSGKARWKLGPLYRAAITHFGSWKEALEAAGIPYHQVARRPPFERWTRDRILQEIRVLAKEGRDRAYAYLKDCRYKLYSAARNHFGSWREALKAAGLLEKPSL